MTSPGSPETVNAWRESTAVEPGSLSTFSSHFTPVREELAPRVQVNRTNAELATADIVGARRVVFAAARELALEDSAATADAEPAWAGVTAASGRRSTAPATATLHRLDTTRCTPE
jgi:hypothetical protein